MTTLTLQIPHKTLIIPVAIPGSGKSTLLARFQYHANLPGFRFGADDVRTIAFGDVSYQGDGRLVHEAARAVLRTRLADGRTSCYDATNVTHKARKPLIELAREYGFRLVALVSQVPFEVACERNDARIIGKVPQFVMERMESQRQGDAVALDCDQIYFFDQDTDDMNVEWTD